MLGLRRDLGITRRSFLAGAAGAVGVTAFARVGGAGRANTIDVAKIDHDRILRAAARYLEERPLTLTASSSPRSAGGKHDYFSEGDYWWPDPANPQGPYIQRDGMSNPENFNDHRKALIRFGVQMPALTAAWLITRDKKYASHAASHLRAWFVDDATRMNPNLQYAQAIHGRTTGRGTGIIDTVHLVEVARAASLLESSRTLTSGQFAAVRKWFADYLAWMTTSRNGIDERNAKNNHGTCWVVQVAEFATFTGNQEQVAYCRDRFKNVILPHQIAADGSEPEELRRTKPYGYCLFNLDALAMACHIVSSGGENLWHYTTADGRGMDKVLSWMAPYIRDKNSWPYPHDVQYWDDWPVRQPSLLFGGLALGRSDYLALWEKLNPDPTVEEIIRNFPYRQPVLWLGTHAE